MDKFKNHRGETYAKTMNLDLSDPSPEKIKEEIQTAVAAMRQFGGAKGGPDSAKVKRRKRMQAAGAASTGEDGEIAVTPPVLDGLVLARASELPQPEKDEHFLRMFGQSDRQIADSGSDEGSIPQVMMLMNGEAQEVIGSDRSIAVQTAARQGSVDGAVESLYLSFFSRKPRADELAVARENLNAGLTLKDLTWVLFNTREFIFVE